MTLIATAVSGPHRRMGAQQGEAFGPQIESALDFYELYAQRSGTKLSEFDEKLGPYIEAARANVPGLAEEVEGLAEGAGIDRSAAWLLNCLEEVWPEEACVTIAVGHFLLHAEQWFAGHMGVGVVVAHPEDGPSFVSPTSVGFLPAVGMNATGFAQGIDSLTARDDRVGIPRLLVSRHALGADGFDAAVAAAKIGNRAGGYAHVLASAQEKVAVETSALRSHVEPDCPAHTNHYLTSGFDDVAAPASSGSIERLRRARQIALSDPPRSLEDCARILADHEGSTQTICLHEEGRLGTGATVFGMACDVATGRMIVSDGNPCSGEWLEFEVPNYDSAGLVGAE